MKTRLRVHCPTDIDLCGIWLKNETEQEMKELGQTPKGSDWIVWLFDHLFADSKLNTESLKDVLVWSGGRIEIANPDGGQAITVELD